MNLFTRLKNNAQAAWYTHRSASSLRAYVARTIARFESKHQGSSLLKSSYAFGGCAITSTAFPRRVVLSVADSETLRLTGRWPCIRNTQLEIFNPETMVEGVGTITFPKHRLASILSKMSEACHSDDEFNRNLDRRSYAIHREYISDIASIERF